MHQSKASAVFDPQELADRIVDVIVSREKLGEHYGTIVLAEGLAEMLPDEMLQNVGLQ